MWSLKVLALVLGLWNVLAVPSEQFYPFGTDHGDTRLPVGDDISSDEFRLETQIAFYTEYKSSIFVNVNGLLSFDTEIPAFESDHIFHSNFKVIAPFLSDVDIRLSGNVYYRETEDPSLLHMAMSQVHRNFPERRAFRPRSLFVVTWDQVGYFDQQFDRVNSYQVVIASDGRDSFVLYLYLDGGLNWVASEGKRSSVGINDIPAQAGFDFGDRRHYYHLPGSGDNQVQNLAVWSNTGERGMWMFHVGHLTGDNIGTPQDHAPDGGHGEPDVSQPSGQSCAEGGDRTCDTGAQCVDYEQGFCCECLHGLMGNGVNCLNSAESPQLRVHGKLSGDLNGVRINEVDLHAFVVINDGRTYIAISRLPMGLGLSMQSLYAIGGGLGWLFAVPTIPKAKNGYMLSGGDINRTATVQFVDSGETVYIRQQFIGHHVQDHLRMETTVSGQMPYIAEGSGQVKLQDYKEEFSRTAPGTVTSLSTQTYIVNGVPHRIQVDQTMTYQECPNKPIVDEGQLRLSVTRNFLIYDDNEQILRFAQTNKVETIVGSDPCLDADLVCDSKAECVPHRDSYRCRCRDGYQGDGLTCSDVDECALNTHDCHHRAHCYNNVGSYDCRCMAGFTGNGKDCRSERSCADVACGVNAECVFSDQHSTPRCACIAGHEGEPTTHCEPIVFSCAEVDNCDENAECMFDPESESHRCECNDGFSGDGFICTDTGEPEISCRNCDVHAQCVYDIARLIFRCQCVAGYTGDGHRCYRIAESCNVINNCDRNARCVPDGSSYICQCHEGFSGSGFSCEPTEPTGGCRADSECDSNARCVYDAEHGGYMCRCNEGYKGDGRSCDVTTFPCNEINNCDLNADCLYNPETDVSYCVCRQGYEGDGYYCRLTGDCRRNQGICDENAHCELREPDYVCVCNLGFVGDGFQCTYVSEDQKTSLLFARGMSIVELPFNPTPDNMGRPVLIIPGQTAIGIDSDCYSGFFYWTDVSGKTISRAKMDGTESEVIMSELGSPEGVAIDWVAKNLYWTDSGLDRIEVSRLDGTSRKTLFDTDLVNPRGIAVDPGRGIMFWTDWNRALPRIERAYMDGSERKDLVTDDLVLPNGLVIDYDTYQVCWVDAGTTHLECANYEGRGRRILYSHASYPFDVTYANNVFYWTDWHQQGVPNINKYAAEPNEGLELPPGGTGRLYGITTVKSQCPAGSNACVLNNGGCRFLCLPTPNGGRTCSCPDDIEEEECNRIGLLL